MPSQADLKKAFKLEPGAQLADNIAITGCDCDHRVAQVSESEEFPMEVTVSLAKGATPDDALSAFKEHVKKSKIVHSQFGKPYEVTFGTSQLSKEEDQAELLGDDYRVMRASLEGVCGECGDKIVPGDAVCTPLASDDPARWAHEACMLAKVKREKASSGQ
ncbi:hypothetical protein N2152v2_003731 [Parachlorella kessleri]